MYDEKICPATNYLFTAFFSCLLLVCLLSSCTQSGQTGGGNGALETSIKYGEPVKDSDGNVYQTVKIGQQTWMAEDLKKTAIECDSSIQVRFTNGIERGPLVNFYDGTPRYAWYNNNPKSGSGVLYSWGVLQKCSVCPPGYRLPTKADWEILVDELGGISVAGKELLMGGKSGFNAYMGGRIDSYGSVLGGNIGFWWSSDLKIKSHGDPETYIFEVQSQGIVKIKPQDLRTGNYIRCIKE